MTHRTESSPPTPIEQATATLLQELSANISQAMLRFDIHRTQHIDEKSFRRILALCFHDKSLADWCRDLGIPDATDPADKPGEA
jgi:hypothetical protein